MRDSVCVYINSLGKCIIKLAPFSAVNNYNKISFIIEWAAMEKSDLNVIFHVGTFQFS